MEGNWILVDVGLPYAASEIKRVVHDRFGGGKPNSILFTYGHFDHVGGLEVGLTELVQKFDKIANPVHGRYVNNEFNDF